MYDITNANWVDLNTRYRDNEQPLLVPDEDSVIVSSLYNLLNCPMGDRGGLFEPEYGCQLDWFLQEPICEDTANRIRDNLYLSILRWEPRLTLSSNGITVTPKMTLPGYEIVVSGVYNITNTPVTETFLLKS